MLVLLEEVTWCGINDWVVEFLTHVCKNSFSFLEKKKKRFKFDSENYVNEGKCQGEIDQAFTTINNVSDQIDPLTGADKSAVSFALFAHVET